MGIRRAARAAALTALAALLFLVPASCGDDPLGDQNPGKTPCGDGVCESSRCETDLRCPIDCGTCTDNCDLLINATGGTCGHSCTTSCDCFQPGEMCSADYGQSPGKCIPVGCRKCSSTENCSFTAEANGACPADVTCSPQ